MNYHGSAIKTVWTHSRPQKPVPLICTPEENHVKIVKIPWERVKSTQLQFLWLPEARHETLRECAPVMTVFPGLVSHVQVPVQYPEVLSWSEGSVLPTGLSSAASVKQLLPVSNGSNSSQSAIHPDSPIPSDFPMQTLIAQASPFPISFFWHTVSLT